MRLLALASLSAATTAAAAPAERKIVTLPEGVGLDPATVRVARGHLAAVALDGDRARTLSDGELTGPFEQVPFSGLAEDGSSACFAVMKGPKAWVLAGGRERGPYGSVSALACGPDGAFAAVVEWSGRAHVVVSAELGDPYGRVEPSIALSSDGAHVAYAAGPEGYAVLYVDRRRVGDGDSVVKNFAFLRDTLHAVVEKDGARSLLLHGPSGTQELPLEGSDHLWPPLVGPDGTVGIASYADRGAVLLVGGRRLGPYRNASQFAIGPRGKRVAWVGEVASAPKAAAKVAPPPPAPSGKAVIREFGAAEGSEFRVFRDGKPESQGYKQVSELQVSADGAHVAYLGVRDEVVKKKEPPVSTTFLVRDGKVVRKSDKGIYRPRFVSDGRLAYLVDEETRTKAETTSVVVERGGSSSPTEVAGLTLFRRRLMIDAKPGPVYDDVPYLEPSDNGVVFVAVRGRDVLLVEWNGR